MNRFAIFVDAAYLYAAGGLISHGTKDRKRLELDFTKIAADLVAICSGQSAGVEHLRTYWYDGATAAVPTAAHLAVAHREGVKLRLGRLTPQGQKGVDSRIVRDLIILSRNRAIVSAYLLSGDDDLTEGVTEAQEQGVLVTLIGVQALVGEKNQSANLIQAADATITLSKEEMTAVFTLREEADVQDVLEAPTSTTVTEEAKAEALGRQFGRSWRQGAPPAALSELLNYRPVIPGGLDSGLLSHAQAELGPLWNRDALRSRLRKGFWTGISATIDDGPDET